MKLRGFSRGRYLALAAAAGLFSLAAARTAQASDPLVISAGTGTLRTGDGFTLGTRFTVGAKDASVSALGVWDGANSGGSIGDGLVFSKAVAIWDSSGTMVASATVPSGTAGFLVGEFRYIAISP